MGCYLFSGYLSMYDITLSEQCLCSPHVYLEGSHAELNTEAQVNTEVVRQKIEEHVVSTKQRDEEERGLCQAPVGQKQRNKMQEVKLLEGAIYCISYLNTALDDMLIIRCQSRDTSVCATQFEQLLFMRGNSKCMTQCEHRGNVVYVQLVQFNQGSLDA